MAEYRVEYSKKNICYSSSKPFGPYSFIVGSNSEYNAAKKAARKLICIGFSAGYNDVWSATMFGPKRTKLPLLQRGHWKIDLGTGKPLEERL